MASKMENSKAGFHTFKEGCEATGGSFEVFWDGPDELHGSGPRNFDGDGKPVQCGWYWWACFPGCLPDGDAIGPFATSKAAHEDATAFE